MVKVYVAHSEWLAADPVFFTAEAAAAAAEIRCKFTNFIFSFLPAQKAQNHIQKVCTIQIYIHLNQSQKEATIAAVKFMNMIWSDSYTENLL